MKNIQDDFLRRFIFDKADVRGEYVSLRATWETIQDRRNYPPHVRSAIGEMTAAAALISATLKFEGILELQFKGTGAIQLMVVEVRNRKTLRATAKWSKDAGTNDQTTIFESGILAVTIKPDSDANTFQGIVETDNKSIEQALESYMEKSEQIATRFWLESNNQRVVGIFLQKLPGGATSEEDWTRITALAETVTQRELLGLECSDLLFRLFNEETVRVFDKEKLSFECTCSDQKISSMLLSMGREEVWSILKERSSVDVTCEFCGKEYLFSEQGITKLFASSVESNAN